MTQRVDEGAAPSDGAEGTWRDRALERSLRTARAKAISRSDRFIATAMEILQETGRTDFTVQELVDRSRTSLRSFYQYFSGKDELLLALLEETIAASVLQWREEIEGMNALDALQVVAGRIYGNSGDDANSWEGLNRALSSYHVGLADTHAADYRRALEPLGLLIHELIDSGGKEGLLRSDISAETLTLIFIQAVVGSALINTLGGPEDSGRSDAESLWEFCRVGLIGDPSAPASPRPKRARS